MNIDDEIIRRMDEQPASTPANVRALVERVGEMEAERDEFLKVLLGIFVNMYVASSVITLTQYISEAVCELFGTDEAGVYEIARTMEIEL